MSTPARADGANQRGVGSVASAGETGGTETAAGESTSAAAAAAAGSTKSNAGKAEAEAQLKSLVKCKNKAKATWWKYFQPVLVEPVGDQGWGCKVKCIRGDPPCGQLLSALNPSKTQSDHFTIRGCKGFKVRYFLQSLYVIMLSASAKHASKHAACSMLHFQSENVSLLHTCAG